MSSEIIKVPDIGGDTDVEIIEIAVSVGDVIEAEDTLITLESDKASMDVPAPKGGKVLKVLVKEGDSVSEGDDIIELEVEGGKRLILKCRTWVAQTALKSLKSP